MAIHQQGPAPQTREIRFPHIATRHLFHRRSATASTQHRCTDIKGALTSIESARVKTCRTETTRPNSLSKPMGEVNDRTLKAGASIQQVRPHHFATAFHTKKTSTGCPVLVSTIKLKIELLLCGSLSSRCFGSRSFNSGSFCGRSSSLFRATICHL